MAQHLCPKNSHEKVISKTLSKIFSLKEYYHVLQMMKNVSGLECRVAFRKMVIEKEKMWKIFINKSRINKSEIQKSNTNQIQKDLHTLSNSISLGYVTICEG